MVEREDSQLKNQHDSNTINLNRQKYAKFQSNCPNKPTNIQDCRALG